MQQHRKMLLLEKQLDQANISHALLDFLRMGYYGIWHEKRCIVVARSFLTSGATRREVESLEQNMSADTWQLRQTRV